jgi:hypothetical protein
MIPFQHPQPAVELDAIYTFDGPTIQFTSRTTLECYDARGTEAKISRVAQFVFIAPRFPLLTRMVATFSPKFSNPCLVPGLPAYR